MFGVICSAECVNQMTVRALSRDFLFFYFLYHLCAFCLLEYGVVAAPMVHYTHFIAVIKFLWFYLCSLTSFNCNPLVSSLVIAATSKQTYIFLLNWNSPMQQEFNLNFLQLQLRWMVLRMAQQLNPVCGMHRVKHWNRDNWEYKIITNRWKRKHFSCFVRTFKISNGINQCVAVIRCRVFFDHSPIRFIPFILPNTRKTRRDIRQPKTKEKCGDET